MSASRLLHELDARMTSGRWSDPGVYGAVVTDDDEAMPSLLASDRAAYGGVPVLESCARDDRRALVAVRNTLPLIIAAIQSAENELPLCGAWIDRTGDAPHRCWEPADLVIWGRLFGKDAVGPRCMAHAVEHCGSLSETDLSGWAVVDLRPRRRALAALARSLAKETTE